MARTRPSNELRPVRLHMGFTDATPGSVLIEMGATKVLCTAAVEERRPPWITGRDHGWVTAEYAMLPGSSDQRVRRDHYQKGRALEISRLIGRSLRSVVNLRTMGECAIRVDCDVIQADGGTRTAAVTGAWLAMTEALRWAASQGIANAEAGFDQVAAISVGMVEGEALLDLDYRDDSSADVDFNVVMSGRGLLVEVQGTAEGALFDRADLDQMLDLAEAGISELLSVQRQALG
ncbi:MAG: ribonuclease PH [bacterium]|nr:ribonuclease PH [bacterium]MDE0131792.1 ribonuclease PH [bacterium]MDE0501410.1 ribonuclease PH [bacterium]